MNFSVNFPLFSVVLCLMSAVISCVLPGRAARRLSLVLTGLVCVSSAVLFAYILPLGENVDYLMGHYPHPWGNELRISILEPLFSMVFSAVLFLCLLGGRKHLREECEELRQRIDDTEKLVRDLQKEVARNARAMESMRPFICGVLGCKKRQPVAISDEEVAEDIEPISGKDL